MRTTAKQFKFLVSVQILIVLAFVSPPRFSVAQGTLNALGYIYPSGGVFGPGGVRSYVLGGVGWSFVPTSDLLVTAVYAYSGTQVSFWQGTSQDIADFAYTSSSGSFQPVTALLLSAGQTYFVSAQNAVLSSSLDVVVYSSQGQDGISPFTGSSYITQFANYQYSQSGQWTANPAGDNSSYLYLGPNFQFQVVPEPMGFELCLLTVGIWIFRRLTGSNYFHVRQTNRPF